MASETAVRIAKANAIEWLTRDGAGLSVPCSRYGRNSADCADVTFEVARAYDDAGGEDAYSYDSLDYLMGLVVNDYDDPAYLVANYHPDEEWRRIAREEWDATTPDAYDY